MAILDDAGRAATRVALRRPRLVLVALCLALWLPGFFTLPPGDRDESRFAQATKQMLETGDFVRIRNGEEERNRKPIGIHWMQAVPVAAAHAVGIGTENPIWPYRLPSLAGGLVAVLATFALGDALLGRRAGLLGAAMLAASVLLVTEVHIAKTDAALLGATTIAMALLARAHAGALGRWGAAGFWLALGVGVLLKGPITPMVVGLTVLSLLAIERRAAWLRQLRVAWGLPLMLAVVLPWFVAIGAATQGRFFSDAVGGDLGRKLASGDESHWGPPGLHLVLLPFLLFPACAALPGGLGWAWRERRGDARFLLAWIVPAWIVFEAAPTKLPHYPLPLYPAICLLLAAGLCAASPARRWFGPGLAGLACVLLAAASLALPLLLHQPWWLGLPAVACVAVLAAWALRADRRGPAAVALLAVIPVYAAVLGWELPRLQPVWIAPRVIAALPPGAHLGSVGFSEPSLMLLGGTAIRWLRADQAVAALLDGTIDTLLVGDRDLVAVRTSTEAAGLALTGTATVRGFNYSRGRWITLTVLSRPIS